MPQKNLTHLVGAKSHRQKSLEAGRQQLHRQRGEEEALEMAWPGTLHEKGPPSICSTDMGSTWEHGQKQSSGYLERKQGRTGMNSDSLPKTGLDRGALLTPYVPLEAKRIERESVYVCVCARARVCVRVFLQEGEKEIKS